MPARRYYSNVGCLFIYLILSFLFFGRGLIGHLSDRYIGIGTDPGAFIFFLEWWKYVLTHHVNPFITYLQWAPTGANVTWNTCIPLFGIASAPLTATLGPIATFNLLVLLCPAFAAWTAFILCRYVCSSTWAAFAGGYVFGFSPWITSHVLGHLALLMMFPAPLMVLVTLRRLNEEISARAYAVIFSLLLVIQFLCWLEAVATESLFGAAAIAIAWWIAPQSRPRLQGLIPPTVWAYLASIAILSPYLYYFFAFGEPALPGGLNQFFSVDPASFLIPTTTTLLGTISRVHELSRGSNIFETGAYIALPMLLIVVAFARSHWREWPVRLLVSLLVIVCVASMGSELSIRSHRPLPLPWAIAAHLPLIDKALPARFSIYGFLVLGIILSLWLAQDSVRKGLRVAGVCGVVLFTLPNLNAAYWTTPLDTPAFFSTGEFKHYIAPGDSVLILPYGGFANGNIWQASSEMYFRLAGGYLGLPPIPPEYLPYFPIVYDLFNLADFPFAGDMLKVFLAQKQVNAVVVADEGKPLWRYAITSGPLIPTASPLDSDERMSIRSLFAGLHITPIRVGGVSFYRVPLEKLDPYKNVNPRDLESRIVEVQLDALISAAEKYVSDGRPLADLNPVVAQRLGLLPPRWVSGARILALRAKIQNGLLLAPLSNGNTLIGVMGAHNTIESLARSYRAYAKAARIASLMQIATGAEGSRSILMLEFDPQQLALVAEFAGRQRATINLATPVPSLPP